VGSFTNGINKGAEDFGFGVRFVNLLDVFGKCSIDDFPSGLVNATPTEIERYSLSEGDVIFIRSSVKPSGVGLTVVIEKSLPQTVYSGFLIRFRPEPEQFEKPFLRYCFYNEEFRREVISKSTVSANANINQVSLGQLEVALPPPPQQRRIATILTTLDQVIEATEKLVEKHQQIKAGLMHDLFTRGIWTRPELTRGDHKGLPSEATAQEGQLRPPPGEAPGLYQDSPIGLVPKAWKVATIERLLDRIIDYRGKTPIKTESGVPLITAKNVRMGFIDPEPREFIADVAYETWMTRGIPKCSDVLFTTEAPLGNVAQIGTTEKVAFAQRVIILQPASWVNAAFLKHLLISAKFQRSVFNLSSGTTALGVKQSEFRKVLVSHPSQTEEQEAIANRINSMEDQEATQKLHLAKLRQQKQGLMHDLLTGRVRV
jgi:type I restriction enzyme S subunit